MISSTSLSSVGCLITLLQLLFNVLHLETDWFLFEISRVLISQTIKLNRNTKGLIVCLGNTHVKHSFITATIYMLFHPLIILTKEELSINMVEFIIQLASKLREWRTSHWQNFSKSITCILI